MNSTAIFKDFDELQRSITESREAWENGTNAQMMKMRTLTTVFGKSLTAAGFSGRMSTRTL